MNFIENETPQKLRGRLLYARRSGGLFGPVGERNQSEAYPGAELWDGVFFHALAEVKGFDRAEVIGFELNPEEAAKSSTRAKEAGMPAVQVNPEDFSSGRSIISPAIFSGAAAQFDAVVGNPPFVRYQYLPAPFQARAEQIFRKLNLPFTKHTNAWVPFILASVALLRPGGRLAMVVPAEIIHVTHAQALRSYLGRECRRLVIVDPEELWFSGTLQGAVILLAEKKQNEAELPEGLGIYPASDRSSPSSTRPMFSMPRSQSTGKRCRESGPAPCST